MNQFYNNTQLSTQIISNTYITEVDVEGFSIALFIKVASSFCPLQAQSTTQTSSFDLTSSSQDNTYSSLDSINQEQEIEQEKSSSLNIQLREDEDDHEQNQYDSSLNNQNNDDGDDDYFTVKKSNIMKNILKSFQRFIEGEKDQERQKELCRLANKSYNFSQLKKLISRNLKTYGKRWNMKAKNMIEKSPSNMLFKHFLENINSIWLEKSKVQDKNEHLFVANFMLQAIENPTYSSKIHFYQKKKCIVKSVDENENDNEIILQTHYKQTKQNNEYTTKNTL